MILQLNPPLPVCVVSKGCASGLAHFVIDYGPEHHVLWGVVLDDTLEVWWVANPDIRFQKNWSMGR